MAMAFPLALSQYLQAGGGHIDTGSRVSRIIINKDRKAVGIRHKRHDSISNFF